MIRKRSLGRQQQKVKKNNNIDYYFLIFTFLDIRKYCLWHAVTKIEFKQFHSIFPIYVAQLQNTNSHFTTLMKANNTLTHGAEWRRRSRTEPTEGPRSVHRGLDLTATLGPRGHVVLLFVPLSGMCLKFHVCAVDQWFGRCDEADHLPSLSTVCVLVSGLACTINGGHINHLLVSA